MIYTPIEDAVFLGKKFSGGEEFSVYNKYGNKLYICNVDGSENRLLCEIKENNFEFLRAFPGVAGVFGMGDYIIHKLICYRPMKNKQEYIEKDQEKILVVNIVTGEYKILSVD